MNSTATPASKRIILNHSSNKTKDDIRIQVKTVSNYLMKKYGYTDWNCLNDWDSHKTTIIFQKI